MASTSDFSQILELQQIQKLYEEQEARVKHQLAERDQEAADLRQEISERDRKIAEIQQSLEETEGRLARSSAEQERLQREAQEKIDKLSERVRALNMQIMDRS